MQVCRALPEHGLGFPSEVNPWLSFSGGSFASHHYSWHKNPRGPTKVLQPLHLPVCCVLQPRWAKVEDVQGECHEHTDGKVKGSEHSVVSWGDEG